MSPLPSTMNIARFAQNNLSKVIKNLKSALKADSQARHALYLKGGDLTVRRWTDTEQTFRQESFFYYVTGCAEPGYEFVYDLSKGTSTLFMPVYSQDHALWSGQPPSLENQKIKYGVDQCLEVTQVPSVLSDVDVIHVLELEELKAIQDKQKTTEHLRWAITEARVYKSEEELELMRQAAKISGEAHIALMQKVKPGEGSERELQALFQYECFRKDAPFQAYTPIVAAGRNGAVLHYVQNNQPIPENPDSFLLVDAGCEYGLYASDITRTYPIGGKFTGEYKTTYEIVLDAQKAVLTSLKAGVEWEDMHRLAARVILKGLMKAGLVKGSEEELTKHHIVALFFPHGLGHLLGIDVHDCGGYPKGVERINEPGIRYLRMRRTLHPGMVVTVEPGVYFVDAILEPAFKDPVLSQYLNIPLIQEFRKVGGVRIEDDVVILEDGIENLTGWVPKEISDIEHFIKG